VMTEYLKRYLQLESQLYTIRQEQESALEDEILNEMENLWYALGYKERDQLDEKKVVVYWRTTEPVMEDGLPVCDLELRREPRETVRYDTHFVTFVGLE
jgi:hypothetical protein